MFWRCLGLVFFLSDIRNESEFFSLMILLADQIGDLLNKNELSSTLKMHNETLTSYIHILEKCFHIDLIRPFFRNVRKEITKMPKIYYQDTGLRNAMLNRFHKMDERSDKGALLENYVFLRLKDLSWPTDVRFWRTADGHEVDFVVTDDLISGKAYEVKYGQFNPSRNPYRKFCSVYPMIQLRGIDYERAVYL
ncbi:MAG: DUF4143 domain-containing protein [Bacteroidota bacterium]|nr:DUF4143 domain-containing protein [Bacteroidota bacterium]